MSLFNEIKGKTKNITETFIKQNKKEFDEIFSLIIKNELDKIDSEGILSSKEKTELIEKIKKSNMYFGYFSLEDLRNGKISPDELARILREDVLYYCFNDEVETLANGLYNMICSLISLKVHPKSTAKFIEQKFNLSNDMAETIVEFYSANYCMLQMNFLIDLLAAKK